MITVLSETLKQEIAVRIKSDTWFILKSIFSHRVDGPVCTGILLEDATGEFTVFIQPTSSTHFNLMDEDWDVYRILGKDLKRIHIDALCEVLMKLLEKLSGY